MAKKKCDECQNELLEGQNIWVNKMKKDGKEFCSKTCHDRHYEKNPPKCDKCSKNIGLDNICYSNPNKDDGKLFCSQECYKKHYQIPTKYILIGLVVIVLIFGAVFLIYKNWNKKKKY